MVLNKIFNTMLAQSFNAVNTKSVIDHKSYESIGVGIEQWGY